MVDETIARLNVEHFRKLLAIERDEARVKFLRQLLAEAEQKLAEALHRKQG